MPDANRSGRARSAEEGGPADIPARAPAAPRARGGPPAQPRDGQPEVLAHAAAEVADHAHPAAGGPGGPRPGRPRQAQPGPPDRAARAGAAGAAETLACGGDFEAAGEPRQACCHRRPGANRASARQPDHRRGAEAGGPAPAPGGVEPGIGFDSRLQHHARCRDGRHLALRGPGLCRAKSHDPAWLRHARRPRRGGPAMSEELTYEQAMDKLEETLKRMESDKLSLDEAVKAAEDAQKYFRICVQRLEEARKKIEVRAETEPTV